jgi:choline kinase
LAKEFLNNEPFILINGDLYCDPAIFRKMLSSNEDNVVPFDSTFFDEEELKIKIEDGRASKIMPKKTGKGECEGSTIGAFKIGARASGVLFKELADLINNKSEKRQWFEYALNNIFKKSKFSPLDIAGYKWVEIDTIEDLEKARSLNF